MYLIYESHVKSSKLLISDAVVCPLFIRNNKT